jgi:1,2-diacylglycerol 3-alpha-glucosyltransferase
MKIGIFTDAYEPHISGVTTSIKMLKTALEKMHHEVFIVTANLDNNKFIYDDKNRIIYLPGIKTGIYETKLTGIYSKKAMKIIKNWHLDVIHSQTEFGIGYFSRIVAKKLNLPIVHTYHTLYEDYVHYVTHGHFNNLAKKLAIKITKYYCEKKCDELIVPTDKIKDLFINKYNISQPINVIPTGIDIDKFKLTQNIKKEIENIKKKYKIKDTDFIIGSVGRIAPEKSFDKLLYNIKEMIKVNTNIKVMLVGGGPDLDNLKELTKKLHLEDYVIFTDKVNYDLVPAYFNTFNVIVSFSKTETQGLTIIEGLAASKPTICIEDDSFKAMIEPNYNGYLFKNDNEFKDYIFKLMNDKKLYKDMSTNARNSTYKYSKEVFASEVLKVYHKAIEKKSNSKKIED